MKKTLAIIILIVILPLIAFSNTSNPTIELFLYLVDKGATPSGLDSNSRKVVFQKTGDTDVLYQLSLSHGVTIGASFDKERLKSCNAAFSVSEKNLDVGVKAANAFIAAFAYTSELEAANIFNDLVTSIDEPDPLGESSMVYNGNTVRMIFLPSPLNLITIDITPTHESEGN